MVIDHTRQILPNQPQDYQSWQKTLEQARELAKKAKEIDDATKQRDCETDEKLVLLKQILDRLEKIDGRLNALEEINKIKDVIGIPSVTIAAPGFQPFSGVAISTGSSSAISREPDKLK